ncbi:hypothetical protein STAS_12530 [Striga asiatica]|uniref:Uncharacterized protein n=1 Tax=Striga asiatica TaxID=4170 RepID=A0A5A7PTV8_STRAF|nr:hypothetical protein STAS_12530 [Striga asiatica]
MFSTLKDDRVKKGREGTGSSTLLIPVKFSSPKPRFPKNYEPPNSHPARGPQPPPPRHQEIHPHRVDTSVFFIQEDPKRPIKADEAPTTPAVSDQIPGVRQSPRWPARLTELDLRYTARPTVVHEMKPPTGAGAVRGLHLRHQWRLWVVQNYFRGIEFMMAAADVLEFSERKNDMDYVLEGQEVFEKIEVCYQALLIVTDSQVTCRTMAFTVKQMSLIVATLGILSFVFRVIAENKKVKVKPTIGYVKKM